MLRRVVAWSFVVACGPALAAVPDRIAIAPIDQALSFARVAGAEGPRLLAVLAYGGGAVEAVDLGAALGRPVPDPVELINELGYEALRARIAATPARSRWPADALIQPLALGGHHIAAGTNYPAHADEADVEGGPFLFPKRVVPTGPRAPVSVADRLLDYEVELCWVPLKPLRRSAAADDWGLLLCNDYTDRARLLRHIDPDDVGSGKGFTTGKSFPGALPVGDLFVIPRDPRRFAANLVLRLYRNGRLKQESTVRRAIWDIDELLRQSWARAGTTWEFDGAEVGLFAQPGELPAGSLILSGTPQGTIFQGIGLGQKLRGAARWLAGGWDRSLPDQVIETYIDDARASGVFLQPGETVTIRSDYLGSIVNPIRP